MRKPITQRIKELEERKRALQSRLDRQERAQATRRKMLLGSFVLEQLGRNEDASDLNGQHIHGVLKQWIGRSLPAFLTRDADRALFADLLDTYQTAQTQGATGDDAAKGNAQHSGLNRARSDASQASVREGDGP